MTISDTRIKALIEAGARGPVFEPELYEGPNPEPDYPEIPDYDIEDLSFDLPDWEEPSGYTSYARPPFSDDGEGF